MRKEINPRDGLRYVTNLSLQLLNGKPADNHQITKISSADLAEFLQSEGYIRIKYCHGGNPYTYFCLKGIDQKSLVKLWESKGSKTFDQFRKNHIRKA